MFQLNFFFWCYLALGFLIPLITADCTLILQERKPILSKKFGQKTIIVRRSQNNVVLKLGDTVTTYCSKGYRLYSNNGENFGESVQSMSSISFKCSRQDNYDYFYFTQSNLLWTRTYAREIKISCNKDSQSLYEMNQTLPNCGDYSSYGIGAITNNHQILTAAICFDFESLSAKYIKTFIDSTQYSFIDDSEINNSSKTITLGSQVENFNELLTFPSNTDFENGIKTLRNQNPLLGIQEFEFDSLIQINSLHEDIKNFDYLLNTIWWRNLRLGSWEFFLTALKNHNQKVKYISYTGTFKTIKIPSLTCRQNATFEIETSAETMIRAPEIIWMYLKPVVPNTNDEFVVVGYNTPFFSNTNAEAVCTDICSEIEWLQNENFIKVHLMPSFGVVHCCRPEEVAGKIPTFPMEEISKAKATTEVPNGA